MPRQDAILDDRVFQRQLAEWLDRSGVDKAEGLKMQYRLALQEVVRFTPPRRQSQGNRATEAGVRLAITPLSPGGFDNPAVKEAIAQKRYDALNRIAEKSRGWQGWRAVPFSPSWHRDARGRDGRVRRSSKTMTPDKTEWDKYLKRKKRNVGLMKAGWIPGLAGVDPTLSIVPKWVSRHAIRYGTHEDRTKGSMPFIAARNNTMGVRRQASLVEFVLRKRAGALRRDLAARLMESGRRVGWMPGLR